MKAIQFAKILELKYNLVSKAEANDKTLNQVKNDLVNSYNLYVNSSKARDPILQMLANQGEEFSISLIKQMEELVANIDSLSILQLFNRINKILKMIKETKEDTNNTVRNFINDNTRISRESDRNHRERLKSKFDLVLVRLASIFQKCGELLITLVPGMKGLESGQLDRQKMQLSKQKLFNFMMLPIARKHGLNNLNILERILNDEAIKNRLITLINSLDRGHNPHDPAIEQEAANIKAFFDNKKTNEEEFEEDYNLPSPQVNELLDKEKAKQLADKLKNDQIKYRIKDDKQEAIDSDLNLCPVCHTDHQDPDNTCDYEECGYCGFDHGYEKDAAAKWHKENDPENEIYL